MVTATVRFLYLLLPWAEVGVEDGDNLSGGAGKGVPQVAGLLEELLF